jgi:hypothetical protein
MSDETYAQRMGIPMWNIEVVQESNRFHQDNEVFRAELLDGFAAVLA